MEVIEGLIYRTDNRGLLKRTGLCYQRARCSLQERTHYKTYRKSRTLGVGQQHCLSFAIEAFCDTWFVIASFLVNAQTKSVSTGLLNPAGSFEESSRMAWIPIDTH